MTANEFERPLILAVDPGREKCGLALVDGRGGLHRRAVVATAAAPARVREWRGAFGPDPNPIGAGTGSRALQESLMSLSIAVERVPERESTLRARTLYFAEHPPRGLRRLLPRGLLTPPVPIDDYAACAIALDWLARRQAPPAPQCWG